MPHGNTAAASTPLDIELLTHDAARRAVVLYINRPMEDVALLTRKLGKISGIDQESVKFFPRKSNHTGLELHIIDSRYSEVLRATGNVARLLSEALFVPFASTLLYGVTVSGAPCPLTHFVRHVQIDLPLNGPMSVKAQEEIHALEGLL